MFVCGEVEGHGEEVEGGWWVFLFRHGLSWMSSDSIRQCRHDGGFA